jgi:geranylgeranyl diphosphate synthase type II
MSIDSDDENAKIEAVKLVFNELQIREAAEQLMESYLVLAFEHLGAVNVADEKKEVLINLSHGLMGREV